MLTNTRHIQYLLQSHYYITKRLTLWEPVYVIFVLRFQPKKLQCSVASQTPNLLCRLRWRAVQGLKQIGQSSRLHSKKIFFGWGVRIFCDWRHKWSSFGVILVHVAWPRAQPLGQSVSLKFSLEIRLEFKSFEPLIDFLAFLVQTLWSKINKLIK